MSLVAREYALDLDEALEGDLTAKERRLAWRDVRQLLDDFAFHYAIREGRVPPEDSDYERVVAHLKAPKAAATVFARRKPEYSQRIRRKRIVSASILTALVVFGALAYTFVTSEASEHIFSYSEGGADLQPSTAVAFDVEKDYLRLQIMAQVFSQNAVMLVIQDPSGDTVWSHEFGPRERNWAHAFVDAPLEGRYTLRVLFDSPSPRAEGISVEVRGVYATRG